MLRCKSTRGKFMKMFSLGAEEKASKPHSYKTFFFLEGDTNLWAQD